MQDTFDVTTIIFLALAVFVIWRLRSVLGQKTGREQPPLDPFVRREAQDTRPAPTPVDNVVRLPTTGGDRATVATAPVADRWAGVAEPQSPLARGLDSIVAVEPGFDPRGFAEGAKGAYEMIVMAFAQGDRKTLKGLLSREVFEGFDAAIAERDRRGEKVETTFVSLDRAEILAADVRNGVAQVTVRFVSKLITATRNAQGAVIDGSAETVVDVTDVWTFARTLGSADPNWQLVATEAAGQ